MDHTLIHKKMLQFNPPGRPARAVRSPGAARIDTNENEDWCQDLIWHRTSLPLPNSGGKSTHFERTHGLVFLTVGRYSETADFTSLKRHTEQSRHDRQMVRRVPGVTNACFGEATSMG